MYVSSSYKFCKLESGHHGEQPQGHAGADIEGRHERLAAAGEGQRLVHERAEGGESAAEAHSKQQLQVGTYGRPVAVGKSVDQPYDKAAKHVGGHRAEGEGRQQCALHRP